MGRAWGLGVLAALAACSSNKSGILIEVPLDQGYAELFVPHDLCDAACAAGITPRGATAPLGVAPNNVSFLDSELRLIALRDDDGFARFQISGGDRSYLPAIYVVGFDATDRPMGFAAVSDVKVPAKESEHWRVKLQDASFGPSRSIAGDTVWVWHAAQAPPYNGDPSHASCLAIEHADGTSEAFVPADDPDCDGLPTGAALECNPLWFEYSTPPTQGDVFCSTPVSLGNSVHVCEAGHPSECVDGFGKSCGPLTPGFCVPDAACSTLCGGNYDLTCIYDLKNGSSGAAVPQVVCQFPVDVAGGPCVGNNTVSLDLSGPLGQRCDKVGFTRGLPSDAPMASFGIPDLVPTLFVSVGPNAPAPTCSFSLTWSGMVAATTAGSTMLEVGTTSADRLVVPIQVKFEGTCGTNPIHCTVANPVSEQVWSCGQ